MFLVLLLCSIFATHTFPHHEKVVGKTRTTAIYSPKKEVQKFIHEIELLYYLTEFTPFSQSEIDTLGKPLIMKAVDEVHYLIEFLEKCRSSLVNITKIDFYNSIEADQKFSTLHEAENALYDYYKKAKKRSNAREFFGLTIKVSKQLEYSLIDLDINNNFPADLSFLLAKMRRSSIFGRVLYQDFK